MFLFFCFRCSRTSTSEGLHCSYCDNDELKNEDIGDPYFPVQERRSESPGYYISVADASTQTFDEDFMLLKPKRDASTQTVEEDFMCYVATREASTQTTEDDFNCIAQMVECNGYRNYTEKDDSFEGETSNHFDQDFVSDHNLPHISNPCQENAGTEKMKTARENEIAQNIEKIECGKCKKHFLQESSFYAHIKSSCDPFPFKCDVCQKKFDYENILITHRRSHSEKSL